MIGVISLTDTRLKSLRRQHQRAMEHDDKAKAEDIEDKIWDEYKQFNKRYDKAAD